MRKFSIIFFRGSVHVGLLLWICEKNQDISWFWMHSCSLYGAGEDVAGKKQMSSFLVCSLLSKAGPGKANFDDFLNIVKLTAA